MEEKILKTGSNELEIVLFRVGDQNFGINVAKVKEILRYSGHRPIPHAPKALLGIFQSRNRVLPLISLRRYMNMEDEDDITKSKIIITDYFNLQTAFLVDDVYRLFRIKWEDIIPPSEYEMAEGYIIGTTQIEEKLVHLLDFERIVIELNPEVVKTKDESAKAQFGNIKIVMAEDSDTTRKLLKETLESLGFEEIKTFKNGKEAYDYLLSVKKRIQEENSSIKAFVDILITDIEMPQMDGYTLTKLIKEDPLLKVLPVIIFSSISSPEVHFKKDIVGADVHITKYDIPKLAGYINVLVK